MTTSLEENSPQGARAAAETIREVASVSLGQRELNVG
jgi:hypothetical protein